MKRTFTVNALGSIRISSQLTAWLSIFYRKVSNQMVHHVPGQGPPSWGTGITIPIQQNPFLTSWVGRRITVHTSIATSCRVFSANERKTIARIFLRSLAEVAFHVEGSAFGDFWPVPGPHPGQVHI